MNSFLLLFIILVLICIVLYSFYNISLLKSNFSKLENKYNNLVLNNIELPTELSLDKLKVKDIEIENSLLSDGTIECNNIFTSNINSIDENEKININNDIQLNKNLYTGLNTYLVAQPEANIVSDDKNTDFSTGNIQTGFIDIVLNAINTFNHLNDNEAHTKPISQTIWHVKNNNE